MTERPVGAPRPGVDVGHFFSRIAPRYDRLNRLMSLGMDDGWRRVAAEAAGLPARGRALDVGAGTGELSRALRRRWPDCTAQALDPEPAMAAIARGKPELEGVAWVLGDGMSLPFPDATFDAVVSAFVLRNVPDRKGALAEQRRVTRPGGRVVCLEMTWPRAFGFRFLFRLYFSGLLPRLTGRLSGEPEAFRYLPDSVRAFLTPRELALLMGDAGLADVTYRMLALGTVAVHVGIRG